MLNSSGEIYYPLMGMNYIIDKIEKVIDYRINDQEKIIIHLASQLNSFPHIGSLVNFMCGFSLAHRFRDYYNIPVELIMDYLENVPGEQLLVNKIKYAKSIKDTFENGISIADKYQNIFDNVINKLSNNTGIPVSYRNYAKFQENPYIREGLIKIINDYSYFCKLLSPATEKLHLRFPCPVCKYMDKHANTAKFEKINDSKVVVSSKCFEHGIHSITIERDNTDYVDINVPLRNITKSILFLEQDKENNSLSVLVDGGDWAGIWTTRIYLEGLLRLNYKQFPLIIFTPTIFDWAGTKLSKRLYAGKNAYKDFYPEGIINYSYFYDDFGENAFDILWNEICKWTEDPKKFFRDYTVEYFLKNIFKTQMKLP